MEVRLVSCEITMYFIIRKKRLMETTIEEVDLAYIEKQMNRSERH